MNKLRRQLTNSSIKSIPNESVDYYTVVEVREKMNKIYEDNPKLFDELDMKNIVGDTAYLRRFIRRTVNVDDSVKFISNVLAWRKENKIPQLTFESFPREWYENDLVIMHESDYDGNICIYGRVKLFVKSQHFKDMFNMFLVFLYYKSLEKAILKGEQFGFTVVFDITGTSLSQYDLSYTLWAIDLISTKLPYVLKKLIVYEMPWLFKPILKTILAFVPEDWKNLIHYASYKDIKKHIPIENLPQYIKPFNSSSHKPFTNLKDKKTLKEMTEEELELIGMNIKNLIKYTQIIDQIAKLNNKK